MRLCDVKIGEKFYHLDEKNQSDRMYLRIDMNPSEMFLTRNYNGIVCALDLTTYKVMCINADYEVEVEHDNVFI